MQVHKTLQVYSKLQSLVLTQQRLANQTHHLLGDHLTWEEIVQGGERAPKRNADTSRSTGDRIWDKETEISLASTVLSRTCMNTIEKVAYEAQNKFRASRQGHAGAVKGHQQ